MQFLTQHNYHKKIILFSSAILAISALLLSTVIVWLLYETAFQEKQADLVETAQSQARLIEAVAQFDTKYSTHDVKGGALAATMSQIVDAHQRYKGFGETGEFTLAKREGDQIVFLLSHRHFDLDNPKPVSWDSHLAEPMRQALKGQSGTLVGLDYRGETVLAAYEPVSVLNFGIVAKVDLAEIRAPFIRTGLIALGITLLIIVAGVVAMIRLVNPIIMRMTESETYLQAILDNAPLTIYLKDMEGRYLFANRYYQQLFRHDPTGQLMSEIFPIEVAHELQNNDLTVLKSKTSMILEEKIPHTEGLHTYLSIKFPIIDYQGNISAICGISTDITNRKCTEEALKNSETLLNEAQKIAHIGHWEWNIPNNELWWSDEIYRIFGLTPQEFGATYEAFLNTVHPDDRELIKKAIEQALSEKMPYSIDHRIVLPNGIERIVHEQGQVTWDETGQAIRMVGTVQDITEQKQAETALQESEARFRALFEGAPDAIFLAYIETGEIIDANLAACQLMQKSRKDIIGLHKSQLHPPKTQQFSRQKFMVHSRLAQKDKNIQVEDIILRSDGREVPVEILAHQIHIQGKPILQAVFRDITERKQAEEKLRCSEERFRKIFEEGPIGMTIVDMNFQFIQVNTAFCQMLGYTTSEIMGLKVADISYPDDMPQNREYLKQALNGEIPFYQMDKRYVRKDGQIVWGHLTVSFLHNEKDKPIYLLGKIEDITARKHAEEALKESENRYRSVITALQEGIVLQDAQGNLIACNPSAERILGLTQEQMLERTSVDPRWQTIYEDGSPFPTEERPGRITLRTGEACLNVVMGIYKPDGRLRWISINSQPLLKEDENKPYAVVCSFVDITERKLAEEALQKSEEHYRRILQNTSEGYWLIDHNAETLDVNQSLCNMLGYSREELLGKKPQDFVDAENLKIFQHQISRRDSTPHRSYEITLKHKNGNDIFTHFSATTIKNEKPLISFALVTDMTASRQAAEALRKSEERFRTLVSHIPGVVYRCANDKDWTMEYISGEVDKISGYPTSDFLNNQVRSYASVIHPDDQDRVDQQVQEEINNKRPYTLEYRIIHKNGRIKWAHEKGRAIFDEQGQLLWLDGVIFDITERKRTERALVEKNAFIGSILQSSINMAIIATDVEFQITYYNPIAEKIFGYSAQQAIGKSVVDIHIKEKVEHYRFDKAIAIVKREGEYSYSFEQENGERTRYIESRLSCIRDQNEKLRGFLLVANDVTARKYAERALRDSEEQLRTVADFTYNWEYWLDPNNNPLYVSPSCERISGYSNQEFQQNPKLLETIIHPDDFNAYKSRHQNCLLTKGPCFIEFRIIHRHGGIRWIGHVCQPVFGHDGRWLGRRASNQDITERKTAEKALQETNKFLEKIMNSTTNGIFVLDLEGKFINVNQTSSNISGYSSNELIGQPFSIILAPKILPEINEQFLKVAVHGDTVSQYETEIIRKDGSEAIVTFSIAPMLDGDMIVSVVGTAEDITERKRAEAALKQSQQRYESLVHSIDGVVWEADAKTFQFTFVSQQAEKFLGYPIENWLNQPNFWVAHIHPEDQVWAPSFCLESTLQKQDHEFEYRMITADNRTIWLRDLVSVIVENDQPVKICGVMLDITQRKYAEQTLKENEQNLQAIFNSTTDAFIIADLEGHIVDVNQRATQIYGYPKAEFVTLHANQVICPEYHSKLTEFIQTAQSGKIASAQTVDLRKDGSFFYTEINGTTLKYNGKKHLLAIIRDVTERKRAEDALKESEERFRSLVEQAADAIFVHDLEGRFVDINQSACDSVGYTRSELLNLTVTDLEKGVSLEQLKPVWQQIKVGEPVTLEGNHRRKDGTRFQVEVRLGLIKWEGSKYILAAARDITERKRVEEILKNRAIEFNMAQEIANLGSYTINLLTGEQEWSEQVFHILGIDRKEFSPSHENFMQLVHPEDKGLLERETQAAFLGKKSLDAYYRIIRKDDGIRFLHSGGIVEYNDKKIPVRMYGFTQDITERKRAEEKLLIQAKVLDSMAEGVNLTTEEGYIFLTNPAFEQMFGYSKNELIGKHVSILNSLSPEENIVFVNNIIADLQTKGIWEGEVDNQKKDGTHFISYAYISALEISDQKYFVSVQEDITERKQAEIALKQAKEQAESANRAKSEFLATMSHEIRTPMNAVLGFSELLSELVTDKRQKSYLDSIHSAGKTLLTLINDILDLAKIEAGRLDIQYEAVNPYNIFEELKQIFVLKIADKQLDFIVDIEKNLPLALILDEVRLRQVLLNLIGNAVKFTEKGYIKLRAQKVDKVDQSQIDLHISVEDTGIGIPFAQQEMIFEAFRQQDGQSTRKYGGTGLGLAITKRLVEMMNGDISVTSTVEQGSIFNLTLREVDISPVLVPLNTQEPENILSICFEKERVLVVDDIESNRILVREWLSQVNLEVIEAEDGQIALHQTEKYQPDLILMDIRMPVMDGYETTKRLKNHPQTQKIPIIALTASAMLEDKTQLQILGFDGYLSKPVQANALFVELSRFLTPNPKMECQTPKSGAEKKLILENIVQLPELMKALEENLLPQWKEIEGIWEIETLETFSDNIIKLGNIHNVPIFIDYAEQLREFAQQFDISNIEQTFNQFYELLLALIKMQENHE
jgi:PAS domain S-box-containing protein